MFATPYMFAEARYPEARISPPQNKTNQAGEAAPERSHRPQYGAALHSGRSLPPTRQVSRSGVRGDSRRRLGGRSSCYLGWASIRMPARSLGSDASSLSPGGMLLTENM